MKGMQKILAWTLTISRIRFDSGCAWKNLNKGKNNLGKG